MIISPYEQGTDEWLLDRAPVVTTSCFSNATSKGRGKAPSKTKLDYMKEKANAIITQKLPVGGYKNAAMQRGNDLEPEAREYYSMLKSASVEQSGLIYLNELKRIGASVDGLVGDDGLVEIKCPNLNTHIDYLTDGVMPSTYIKQVQGQMWVTGRKWCDFISYHPDAFKMAFVIRVARDEEYIKELSNGIYAFIGELDVMVEKFRSML